MGGFNVGGSGQYSKTDTDIGTIYWDQIEKLIGIDEKYNRINRYGPFGGWEYDPETKSQSFKATSPGMQSAMDRMNWRMQGGGFENYQSPAQFSSLLDASAADQMYRKGIFDPNKEYDWSLQQSQFGDRAGHQAGGWASGQNMFQPQPQEPMNPMQPPPQQGGPAPGGPAPGEPAPGGPGGPGGPPQGGGGPIRPRSQFSPDQQEALLQAMMQSQLNQGNQPF